MLPRRKEAYEYARRVLPTSLLDALKSMGLPKITSLAFFVDYHLKYGFFDHAEAFLADPVDNARGLTRGELYAIWGYTTRLFYKELNTQLRENGAAAATRPIYGLIVAGLQKLPLYQGVAYRKIELTGDTLNLYLDDRPEGATIVTTQFISCGDNDYAADRNKTGKNVVEYYEVVRAYDISAMADGIRYREYSPRELLAFPPKYFNVNEIYYNSVKEIYYLRLTENTQS